MVLVLLNVNVEVHAFIEKVLNATFGEGEIIKALVTVLTHW